MWFSPEITETEPASIFASKAVILWDILLLLLQNITFRHPLKLPTRVFSFSSLLFAPKFKSKSKKNPLKKSTVNIRACLVSITHSLTPLNCLQLTESKNWQQLSTEENPPIGELREETRESHNPSAPIPISRTKKNLLKLNQIKKNKCNWNPKPLKVEILRCVNLMVRAP